MWTKAQVAAHQRALATAKKWEEAISRLEELARITPAFAERVADLKAARDHLELSAGTALAIDPKGE